MISTGTTFLLTIVTLDVYYQSVLHREHFFKTIPWVQTSWLMIYLTGTLIIIHHSSRLTNEVSFTFFRLLSTLVLTISFARFREEEHSE